VPDRLQGGSKARRHRDPSRLASLGRADLAVPIGAGDGELAAPEVGVGQIERDDLASSNAPISSIVCPRTSFKITRLRCSGGGAATPSSRDPPLFPMVRERRGPR